VTIKSVQNAIYPQDKQFFTLHITISYYTTTSSRVSPQRVLYDCIYTKRKKKTVEKPSVSDHVAITVKEPTFSDANLLEYSGARNRSSMETPARQVLASTINACDKVYIGQTSTALGSRTREHKRAIFTGDKISLLPNTA